MSVQIPSFKYLGSLVGCKATGSCDLAEARFSDSPEEKPTLITWGRSLTKEEAEWYSTNTSYRPVLTGYVWEGNYRRETYELAIENSEAVTKLRSMLKLS